MTDTFEKLRTISSSAKCDLTWPLGEVLLFPLIVGLISWRLGGTDGGGGRKGQGERTAHLLTEDDR